MHLLDTVVAWDEHHAVCEASSHCHATNPLRENGRLPALAGIEYAAQAMAVHGGLTAARSTKPVEGYLVSLRDVTLNGATLDDVGPMLTVRVDRIAGDATSLMYRFAVSAHDRVIVRGRATIVLTRGTGP